MILLGTDGERIQIYFREGMIDAVSSTRNDRRIGDYLFPDGHGSTTDREGLESEARRKKTSFGDVAIRRGLVDPAGLASAARSQAIELLVHALNNEFYVESFSSSLSSYRVPAGIDFAFVKLELTREGALNFDPQPDLPIALSKAADLSAFPWRPQELGVLGELTYPNTFDGLLRATGLEERTLRKILGVFNDLGIIEFAEANAASDAGAGADGQFESGVPARQAEFPFEHLIPVVANATLDDRIIAARERGSFTSEQFNHLKIQLGEAGRETPIKVLTVSSPGTQDGKSFVSTNLALSFSMDRARRTIIIDCDLRSPSIHKYLGVPTDPGLMQCLAEVRLSPYCYVRRMDHLYFLTAGGVAPNPVEILSMESSPFLVETLHGSRWVMQPSSSISSTSSPQFSALAGGLRGALEDDGSRSPSSGAVRCR